MEFPDINRSPLLNSYRDLAKFKEFSRSNFSTIEKAKQDHSVDFNVKFNTRKNFRNSNNFGFKSVLEPDLRKEVGIKLPSLGMNTTFLKGKKLTKSSRIMETENSTEELDQDSTINGKS